MGILDYDDEELQERGRKRARRALQINDYDEEDRDEEDD